MNKINRTLVLFFILVGTSVFSQTVVLNACHPLIENQDYTFNQKALDVTGRNVFETDPVDANSPCGGIGNCEFQIAWNETSSRWEILADDGNGTFTNTYVLYYNTEASLPNPPSLSLGTWIEEIAVTQSECGAIMSLTGDVQDTTLSVPHLEIERQISLYPNPVNNTLYILYDGLDIEKISLYNVLGKKVFESKASEQIDVSKFSSGLYFVEINFGNKKMIKKIIIK